MDPSTSFKGEALDAISLRGSVVPPAGLVVGRPSQNRSLVRYVPYAFAYGDDSFEFVAMDCSLAASSQRGAVSLRVRPVVDAPMSTNTNLTIALDLVELTIAAFGVEAAKVPTTIDDDMGSSSWTTSVVLPIIDPDVPQQFFSSSMASGLLGAGVDRGVLIAAANVYDDALRANSAFINCEVLPRIVAAPSSKVAALSWPGAFSTSGSGFSIGPSVEVDPSQLPAPAQRGDGVIDVRAVKGLRIPGNCGLNQDLNTYFVYDVQKFCTFPNGTRQLAAASPQYRVGIRIDCGSAVTQTRSALIATGVTLGIGILAMFGLVFWYYKKKKDRGGKGFGQSFMQVVLGPVVRDSLVGFLKLFVDVVFFISAGISFENVLNSQDPRLQSVKAFFGAVVGLGIAVGILGTILHLKVWLRLVRRSIIDDGKVDSNVAKRLGLSSMRAAQLGTGHKKAHRERLNSVLTIEQKRRASKTPADVAASTAAAHSSQHAGSQPPSPRTASESPRRAIMRRDSYRRVMLDDALWLEHVAMLRDLIGSFMLKVCALRLPPPPPPPPPRALLPPQRASMYSILNPCACCRPARRWPSAVKSSR